MRSGSRLSAQVLFPQQALRRKDPSKSECSSRRRAFLVAVKQTHLRPLDNYHWVCENDESLRTYLAPPALPYLDTDREVWSDGMLWPMEDFRPYLHPDVRKDGSIALGELDPASLHD